MLENLVKNVNELEKLNREYQNIRLIFQDVIIKESVAPNGDKLSVKKDVVLEYQPFELSVGISTTPFDTDLNLMTDEEKAKFLEPLTLFIHLKSKNHPELSSNDYLDAASEMTNLNKLRVKVENFKHLADLLKKEN